MICSVFVATTKWSTFIEPPSESCAIPVLGSIEITVPLDSKPLCFADSLVVTEAPATTPRSSASLIAFAKKFLESYPFSAIINLHIPLIIIKVYNIIIFLSFITHIL
jgi:hypothetical protein